MMTKQRVCRGLAEMSESDYIDVLDKPFIYTVGLVIYANSLSECIQSMSDGTGREFADLS